MPSTATRQCIGMLASLRNINKEFEVAKSKALGFF
jgi:hypothetical protein